MIDAGSVNIKKDKTAHIEMSTASDSNPVNVPHLHDSRQKAAIMNNKFTERDIKLQSLWSWLTLIFGGIVAATGSAWGGFVVLVSLIWKVGLFVAKRLLHV
ncbi:hypothetical protein RCJ22_17990 [Vibrio sp. FNV 38]|nr:hypothetical protein [Vibrio sp. FNV 38]